MYEYCFYPVVSVRHRLCGSEQMETFAEPSRALEVAPGRAAAVLASLPSPSALEGPALTTPRVEEQMSKSEKIEKLPNGSLKLPEGSHPPIVTPKKPDAKPRAIESSED
jgi:hypothetical protein